MLVAMEPHEVAPLVEAAEEVRVEEERALKERIAARPSCQPGTAASAAKWRRRGKGCATRT